MSDNQP